MKTKEQQLKDWNNILKIVKKIPASVIKESFGVKGQILFYQQKPDVWLYKFGYKSIDVYEYCIEFEFGFCERKSNIIYNIETEIEKIKKQLF